MPLTTKLAAQARDIADQATAQGDETGGVCPTPVGTRLVEHGERRLHQFGLLGSAQRDQQARDAYLAHLPVDRLNQFWWQVGIGDQGEVIGVEGGESLPELFPVRANANLNRVFVGNPRCCPFLCLEAKQIGLLAFHQGLHTLYTFPTK